MRAWGRRWMSAHIPQSTGSSSIESTYDASCPDRPITPRALRSTSGSDASRGAVCTEARCVTLSNCSVRNFPLLHNSTVARRVNQTSWAALVAEVGTGSVSMTLDPNASADRPNFIATEWRVRTRSPSWIGYDLRPAAAAPRVQPVYVASETTAVIKSRTNLSKVPALHGLGGWRRGSTACVLLPQISEELSDARFNSFEYIKVVALVDGVPHVVAAKDVRVPVLVQVR